MDLQNLMLRTFPESMDLLDISHSMKICNLVHTYFHGFLIFFQMSETVPQTFLVFLLF